MKRLLVGVLGILLIGQQVAAVEAVDGVALVTRFWNAESVQEREAAKQALLNGGVDVVTLYRWLQAGPDYSGEVQRGYADRTREAIDGTRYPYVILVPESYDPARSYPVEFMLHGGVSRPFPEEPGSWWRRGFDSLRSEDKSTVVPAAWNGAFWWFPNQADNLRAILREVKRTYNVDDNRVFLTGISDGGTGAYFFAFKQPTEWAAFMPYIGHPGVLRNPAGQFSYQLYFENLMGKPLYMVNGEQDPLYPSSSLLPFVNVLQEAGINHVFKSIEGGGHNTNWLPDESAAIEQFKADNPRDPLPDNVQWVTDQTDRFNRSHWLVIDELNNTSAAGMVKVTRDGNIINAQTTNVDAFTLLLSPDEIDFSRPVAVYVNGALRISERINQDSQTLLNWAGIDLDKAMLFTAELNLQVGR